jgi:hypothetical protein
MKSQNFIELRDLEVYQLAGKLSGVDRSIFRRMNFEDKKYKGDQFLQKEKRYPKPNINQLAEQPGAS